jgi:hypothetical protein
MSTRTRFFSQVLLALLLPLGLAGVAYRETRLSAAGSPLPTPSNNSYSHDAKGLEKEYDPFLKALAKGDISAANESYKVFAIPVPNTWFASYFKKESVEQLGWDYEPELENERKSLLMMTTMLGRGQLLRFYAHCKSADHDPTANLAPRSDSILPDRSVPVEQFTVEFAADQERRFSFLGNFVYVEGAFRYVGKGAYPFWSMPDATRPKQ